MYYKIKISRQNNNGKTIIETYFTDALHFADAAKKVIDIVSKDAEVEDICLMKSYKPSINEPYNKNNKLYLVKIAEDILQNTGNYKTIKYVLPVFANDSNELQKIVNDYIKQGLENMRLTTISETKWIYVK